MVTRMSRPGGGEHPYRARREGRSGKQVHGERREAASPDDARADVREVRIDGPIYPAVRLGGSMSAARYPDPPGSPRAIGLRRRQAAGEVARGRSPRYEVAAASEAARDGMAFAHRPPVWLWPRCRSLGGAGLSLRCVGGGVSKTRPASSICTTGGPLGPAQHAHRITTQAYGQPVKRADFAGRLRAQTLCRHAHRAGRGKRRARLSGRRSEARRRRCSLAYVAATNGSSGSQGSPCGRSGVKTRTPR